MEKQREKMVLPVIGIVLGALALLLSWIPIINNLAFGLAIIGLVLTGISFFTNRKNVKTLTFISLAISLVAGGIVLASQASFSKAIDSATSSSSKKAESTKKVSKITDGTPVELTDITIKVTDSKVIPVGEKGNEYGDKPVIAFWYEATNKSDKSIDPSTAWIATFDAYQDTDKNQENKLNMASLPDDAFLDTQIQNIKKNGTAKNAVAYELDSETVPVDLIATKGFDGDVLAKESISIK
ncbi:DUF5067 domain-containing protein [Weissella tructae]|uniref:DUF5067 domain-containing protein n=1 Tax=Weissella tructae TaxID=887702 RepID=UPI003D8AE66F